MIGLITLLMSILAVVVALLGLHCLIFVLAALFIILSARLSDMFLQHLMFYKPTPWSEKRHFESFWKIDLHKATCQLWFMSFLLSLLTVVVVYRMNQNITEDLLVSLCLFYAFVFVATLFKRVLFKDTHIDSASVLNDINSEFFIVGRAAAINFVDNYLQYVIPCLTSGLQDHKGLTKRIYKFVKHENMRQQDHSNVDSVPFDSETNVSCLEYLFILIPKSGNNHFGSLSEADSYLKYVGNLSSVNLDIEGQKDREYVNTVYCFNGMLDRCVVAEFATPLSSLYQIQKEVGEGLIPNQIEVFYESLKLYIKEELHNYRDMVQLIYYDDSIEHELHRRLWQTYESLRLKPK